MNTLKILPAADIPPEKNNYTYILQCCDGSFYCGWTNDLTKRLAAHNAGTGGKYTRSRLPVGLVWYHVSETKEDAMKREYAIKQLTRTQKMLLIQDFVNVNNRGCN